jgi:hypothetical protein
MILKKPAPGGDPGLSGLQDKIALPQKFRALS